MAETIIRNGPSSTAQPLFPPAVLEGVARSEDNTADVYTGTKEALINAGLVRADQFPPEGTLGISYYSGIARKRRGVIDENYFRVEFVAKTWRVRIGVPTDIARVRTIAAGIAMYARRDAEAEAEDAEKRKRATQNALDYLKELPRTADDFRRKEARAMRRWIQFQIEPHGIARHGFEFDGDAIAAISMASDAIVDAIMAAAVKFDQDKQQRVIGQLQSEAIAGEPSIVQKVAKLIQPDASVLAGEPS